MSRLHSLTGAWNERLVSHTLCWPAPSLLPLLCWDRQSNCPQFGVIPSRGLPGSHQKGGLVPSRFGWGWFWRKDTRVQISRGEDESTRGPPLQWTQATPTPLGGSGAVRWWGGVSHRPAPLRPLFLACYPQVGPSIPPQVQRQNLTPQPSPSRCCVSAKAPRGSLQ